MLVKIYGEESLKVKIRIRSWKRSRVRDRFQETCMGRIGFWIELGSDSDVTARVTLRYSYTVWFGYDDGEGEGSGQGSLKV